MEHLILETIKHSQHGFTKGKYCLTNLIRIYNEMTVLADEGKAVNIFCLDCSKVFDIGLQKNLIEKLLKYGLYEQTVRWIENYLNSLAQRVVNSGTKSSWRTATSDASQASILGSVLFNFIINNLGDWAVRTINKFADDTELGRVADMLKGHAAIQRDLDRLERLADRNLMKFNEGECKVPRMGRNNPMHQYMLGADQWESNVAEKNLEVLAASKLNTRQQCAFTTKKKNKIG
ncbi:PREDICTED: uncharacterized protein LOC104347561 [Leptosomus discolor]|uniref:uncharacterized protein LOC104347561 n=1 Tax=Leptosomus discolor TaxID=188344 RepID=UPI000522D7B0|nr:PREDICTED: uncharacterized protein LOC104347561 [Leptosomus discolor]